MVSFLPLLAAILPLTLAVPVEKRAISSTIFNNLVRFTQLASGAYQASCPRPLGNTLVLQFSSGATDTQGFIARDDTNKQIIVSMRGSQQAQDFLTDSEITLIPLVSPGVSGGGAHAHEGFLTAWNSVASQVISTVKSQVAANPTYQIVTTGHSLGAALSSLAGLSMKSNFPSNNVQLYTFGQPRTGDAAYAALVDKTLGTGNVFRGVHTTDGVPTIIPQTLGYRHHGTEFWNFIDPASTATTKQCSGDEDPTCSDSIPSAGIDAAHLTYFNQAVGVDPTVCQ